MNEKQAAAYDLFRNGYTYEIISRLLGPTERTIVNWAKKFDWKGLKRKEVHRESQTTDMVWELYQYQLEVLHTKVKKMKDLGGDNMELISSRDVDALQKFYVQIKDKAIPWMNYVRIVREFMAYVAEKDLDLAKTIQNTRIPDDFLGEKRQAA